MTRQMVMQAKDIPELAIYGALEPGGKWTMLWDVQARLAAFPPKVVLAKLRKMTAVGKLHGCACGCRGDFHQ